MELHVKLHVNFLIKSQELVNLFRRKFHIIITRTVRQDALSLNLGEACTDKAF